MTVYYKQSTFLAAGVYQHFYFENPYASQDSRALLVAKQH